MSGDRLTVGYIAGAHGIRGGLRVKLYNPGSHAFAKGSAMVLTREGEGEVGRYEITKVTATPGKPDMLRLRIAGVTQRDAAEALQGCVVEVERDALPPLEPGEFYLADAIGHAVIRERDKENLGAVKGVTTNGVQELFEVEYKHGGHARTWLLPIIPGVVLDVNDERVLVDVPPGMLPDELEAP